MQVAALHTHPHTPPAPPCQYLYEHPQQHQGLGLNVHLIKVAVQRRYDVGQTLLRACVGCWQSEQRHTHNVTQCGSQHK